MNNKQAQGIVIIAQSRMSATLVTYEDNISFKIIPVSFSKTFNKVSDKIKLMPADIYGIVLSIDNLLDNEECDIPLGIYFTKQLAIDSLDKLITDFISIDDRGKVYVSESSTSVYIGNGEEIQYNEMMFDFDLDEEE